MPKQKLLLQQYENVLARLVLQAVDELPYAIGKIKLCKFLRGLRIQTRQPLDSLPLYGIFAAIDKSYIVAIIDYLLYKDVLQQINNSTYTERPVLVISKRGRISIANDSLFCTGVSQIRESDNFKRRGTRREKYPNQGKKWEADDDAQLLSLIKQNTPISSIVLQLGRNSNAIERRISKLLYQKQKL